MIPRTKLTLKTKSNYQHRTIYAKQTEECRIFTCREMIVCWYREYYTPNEMHVRALIIMAGKQKQSK